MFRNTVASVGAAVLFLLCCPLWSDSKTDKIDRLLEVSGITAQVSSIPETVEMVFRSQKRVFGDSRYEKVNEIVKNAFSSQNFSRFQREELSRNYDEAMCNKLLDTYSNAALSKITDAEIYAAGKLDDDTVDRFDYATIDEDRDAVLSSLVVSSRTVDSVVALGTGGIHVLITTMNLFLPVDKKINSEQEQAIVGRTVAKFTSDEYLLHIKKREAITYHDISNDELQRYADFYKTPEGDYLNICFLRGLAKAFKSCMEDAGAKIASEFGLPTSDI